MQRRLCNRCNQCGETSEPCTCTEDLIEADQDVADLKQQLAEAEQRAEQAEKDLAATMVEVAEILHNRQAKIEALKTAERNAVRECERIARQFLNYPVLDEYTEGLAKASEAIAEDIRNRYPQHFKEE